jgi:putative FmdB family regulatory protein
VPIYEYECEAHGVFELMREMAQARAGGACPECEESCPRILSVPRISALSKQTRIAIERNEKSQHEPRVATRAASSGRGHVCGSGCNHGQAPKRVQTKTPAAEATTPARRYTGPRPWVVEHG